MEEWKELLQVPPHELEKVKYNDPRLDAFASAVEQRYELPPGLIEAVKNAGERSNTDQVSPKGAKGVMQFIDKTRAAYEHDYKNPLASIDAAGRYFKDLLKQYNGNPKAAIAAYNGGTKAAKAVLSGEEIPYEETRNYWKNIQGYMKQKVAKAPVAKQPAPVQQAKAQPAITPEWAATASHAELYQARATAKTQEEQNMLANYEHRAFAREYIGEDGMTSLAKAVGMAAAIPTYQAAKAVGATDSRSEPSIEQAIQAFKGVVEGVQKSFKEKKNAS